MNCALSKNLLVEESCERRLRDLITVNRLLRLNLILVLGTVRTVSEVDPVQKVLLAGAQSLEDQHQGGEGTSAHVEPHDRKLWHARLQSD